MNILEKIWYFKWKGLQVFLFSTILIIKPGGLRGLGLIIDHLQKSNFNICTMRYIDFRENMQVLSGIDHSTARDLSSGVCAVMEVMRSNAVDRLNELVNIDFKSMNLTGLVYAPVSFADAKAVQVILMIDSSFRV
jgi:hypothetical protein